MRLISLLSIEENDWVIVLLDIDPEFAAWALQKIEEVRAYPDSSLQSMVFESGRASYHENDLHASTLLTVWDICADGKWHGGSLPFLVEATTLLNPDLRCRVIGSSVVVSQDNIWWTTYIKYSEEVYGTPCISREELETIAKGECPFKRPPKREEDLKVVI